MIENVMFIISFKLLYSSTIIVCLLFFLMSSSQYKVFAQPIEEINENSLSEISNQTASNNSLQVVTFNNTNNVSDIDFKTYEDPINNIRIQYPSTWIATDNALESYSDIVAFYSLLKNISDVFPAQMIISVLKYSQNVSLNDYTELVVNAINGTQTLIVNESRSDELANNPAHRIVISTEDIDPPFDFKMMQIWTVIGNEIYQITYDAKPSDYLLYLPLIERSIDSFEITK